MSDQTLPYIIANRPEVSETLIDVTNKFTGEMAYRVSLADSHTIDRAIGAAVQASEAMQELRPFERQSILQHCVRRFEEMSDELARTLCIEAGKPIKDSRGEVIRLIDTFRVAAEEATRIGGEVLNLEISARTAGYHGFTRRFPIGPCSFISPFNFPLNLTAHKIAPAIAAGCTFVLKPASKTPVSALLIGQVLAETDLPIGAYSILPCHRDGAELFTTDPRLKLLSFTGSADVGWQLKNRAGKKKVVLELGGNAACIIHEDADVYAAVDRLIVGAFYQSGQSCISVQRILIHDAVYDEVRAKLKAACERLVVGDPMKEETFIGPIISEEDAERIESWIMSAIKRGAHLITGGKRHGVFVQPTLLEHVPPDEPLVREEVFGPVAVLQRYSSFDGAIRLANDSVYGLQAGVFTKNITRAMQAWEKLQVGGVIINDVPSWRVDNMPYGGIKDSGLGREGIRYAIEDMTEPRMMVIKTEV